MIFGEGGDVAVPIRNHRCLMNTIKKIKYISVILFLVWSWECIWTFHHLLFKDDPNPCFIVNCSRGNPATWSCEPFNASRIRSTQDKEDNYNMIKTCLKIIKPKEAILDCLGKHCPYLVWDALLLYAMKASFNLFVFTVTRDLNHLININANLDGPLIRWIIKYVYSTWILTDVFHFHLFGSEILKTMI